MSTDMSTGMSTPENRSRSPTSTKKRQRVTYTMVDPNKWLCTQGEGDSWYRTGLQNQVGLLLDASQATKPATCRTNDKGITRYSGKDSLHTHVVDKIDSGGTLQGNPFVKSRALAGHQDWGSMPVQSDWKTYTPTDSTQPVTVRTFSVQPLSDTTVLQLDTYNRKQAGKHDGVSDQKFSKYHDYNYIIGHLANFTADVDAPNITQQEFYEAIRQFLSAFHQGIKILGFTETERQRVSDWMGVYESSTTPPPDPSARTKRSVHIHCHVFGPVAQHFEDFAAFLTDNVLPLVDAQFRTLFDVSIYSNGRAFRALGQCKLPLPGCPEKVLHPSPVPQLSGEAILYVWFIGTKKVRFRHFVMGTAHVGVVHDENIPGSAFLPNVTFVAQQSATEPKRLMSKQQAAEQHLHWQMIIEPLFRKAYDESKSTFDSDMTATARQLLCSNSRKSNTLCGFAELWRRYSKKKAHGLHSFIHDIHGCAVSVTSVTEQTEIHFKEFYAGKFETQLAEIQAKQSTCTGSGSGAPAGRARATRHTQHTTQHTTQHNTDNACGIMHTYQFRVAAQCGTITPSATIDAMCRAEHFIVAISHIQGLVFMREMTTNEKTAYASQRTAYVPGPIAYDSICLATLPTSVLELRKESGLPQLPPLAPWAPEIQCLREIGILQAHVSDPHEAERTKLYAQDNAFEIRVAL
jgi:hypothetical protein